MLFKTLSAAVYGIDANIIEVEGRCLRRPDERRRPLHDRRVAGCRGARQPRAHPCGAARLRLRHPTNAHHRQPRSCGTSRKNARDSTCPWPWGSWPHAARSRARKRWTTFWWANRRSTAGVRGISGALPIAVEARAEDPQPYRARSQRAATNCPSSRATCSSPAARSRTELSQSPAPPCR